MNGARCADSPGRVVSFGQVIIDLTIQVEQVPQPGEDVYADRAGVAVGAGFNALYAVRRMGVDAVYAGALGTGPWSDRIRAALEREGIAHGGVTDREDDNGLCIALTDADAERTFVSLRGAETRLGPHGFDNVAVGAGDVAVRLVADACAGSSPENHEMAIRTMELFTPLITVTDSATILG